MRAFLLILLCTTILIALIVHAGLSGYSTVSYRYRLSIAVEVGGQVHSGSSVIDVQYTFNPKWVGPEAGAYNEHTTGQAVLVNLGARGVLMAALAGENYFDRTVVSVDDLAGRAFQPDAAGLNGYLPTVERVRALAKLQGKAELTSNNLPQFYWFPDPANLQSARKIKPTEFASAIGDTAHLVSATVEMTRDPIVTDIDKTLPAYVAMTGPPYCGL
jgi:hypothetical protein